MSVDGHAAFATLLPHLASLLAEVPLEAPVALGIARPEHETDHLDLAFRHLDCTDVVCALGGFTAPAAWSAFGVIAPGFRHHVATRRAPVPVTVVVLMDRTGRLTGEVRDPNGRSWRAGVPEGRLIDTCHRVLGLTTAPPPFGVEVLAALHWVDLVLRAVLDADLGDPPPWATLAALDEPLAWPRRSRAPRPWTWRSLRGAAARGDIDVAGIAPAAAAWMDDGMFSREAVGAFAPLIDTLGDLRSLVPPDVFDRIVERVSTRLGA